MIACSLFTVRLHAQEPDEALGEFARGKLPVSMSNFSFFETYGTFQMRMLEHKQQIINDSSFTITFKRNYKDVADLQLFFHAADPDMFSSATVQEITVNFISKAACSAWLLKLGKEAAPKRWDLPMPDKNCKGVKVYQEGDKKARITTFNECPDQ